MKKVEQKIETPFNEKFCTKLEFRVCNELEKSTDPELKGFWCDGISWLTTENQLTKKHVNDKRKIETKAWIGKTGQTEFKAIINFGQKALSKYAKEMDLTECIPDLESQAEWIEIDIENKTIKIELN
ncbi:hypothetical protein [Formosa algae]|uniref:Uncharacterized protein n=1 Tax=Formosa algae TaxID=225843 RepID=A0A9X1CD66_9FLAO|nr:hypothetical protein [Formosa algae]MBP1841010.1 hypothetical protein [Formosa algae]MDQ0336570.1 hypothetical protein [Formosa algae]OEI81528.1 hypothetical protein AST99_04620 [Formosa algae]